MNKYYPTQQINSAWLMEIKSDRTMGGIKNIIGIVIKHKNETLFYSILDDCFFRVLPPKEELASIMQKYTDRIYVEIYDDSNNHYMFPTWKKLYEALKKDFFTKEEIIANQHFLPGYYSDFDYELDMDTKVDYENLSTIDENIINSESEYREKMRKPITYDEDHIYGPRKTRIL